MKMAVANENWADEIPQAIFSPEKRVWEFIFRSNLIKIVNWSMQLNFIMINFETAH
jgi:hypothetical protein